MIRIGIVGTGGMATSHARNYRRIKGVKLAACCDVDETKARTFAATHGIPQVYTDCRAMFAEAKLSAISNVTPDALHAPISIAAVRAGLHVLCEKPLASTVDEARTMVRAAERAGVLTMVNFSYREASALGPAAAAIAAGEIGAVKHVEASYLQSWLAVPCWGDWRTTPAFTWRLSTAHGSTGVLGDIGCHILDMAMYLAGDIEEIACTLTTFDKGEPDNRIGPYVLDANDSFVASVVFAGGALGTVHSTRWAVGHRNSLRVRVYGDRGGIEVDLDAPKPSYRICAGPDVNRFAWRTVLCKPVPTMYERFVRAIKTGKPDPCDFRHGLKIQAYLAACFESARRGAPVATRPLVGERAQARLTPPRRRGT